VVTVAGGWPAHRNQYINGVIQITQWYRSDGISHHFPVRNREAKIKTESGRTCGAGVDV